LATSVVARASECFANSASWPTHNPTMTLSSLPARFSRTAWAIELHIDSCWPGRIFWASSTPIRSFGTPPHLQQAETTSNPWLSSTRANTLARSMDPMQWAMPTLRKPIRLANSHVSSTRVHWQ